MRKLLTGLLGDAFTVTVLILATTAFQSLLLDPLNPQSGVQGSAVLRAVWAAVYTIVAVRAFRNRNRIVDAIRANRFLLSLIMLAVASTLWSDAPGLTLRRSLAVMATTLFGVDFAVRYSIRKQLRLIGFSLGLVILLSVFVQILFPHFIPSIESPYLDAWNGVFIQKNTLGKIAAFAVVVILVRARGTWWRLFFVSLAIVGVFALIAKTQSVGAFVVAAVMLVLLPMCRIIRWRLLRASAASQLLKILVALPALCLLLPYWGSLFALVGRDSTLTGRAQVWLLSFASIARKPMLGYGYNAFWNVSEQAFQVQAMLGWDPPHAHNSFIDLTLQLGLVGLFLFVGAYAVAVRRAVAYMRPSLGRESIWPFAYLSFTLLYGISEGSFVAPGAIYWITFVAAVCCVTQLPRAFQAKLAEDSDFNSPAQPAFSENASHI